MKKDTKKTILTLAGLVLLIAMLGVLAWWQVDRFFVIHPNAKWYDYFLK